MRCLVISRVFRSFWLINMIYGLRKIYRAWLEFTCIFHGYFKRKVNLFVNISGWLYVCLLCVYIYRFFVYIWNLGVNETCFFLNMCYCLTWQNTKVYWVPINIYLFFKQSCLIRKNAWIRSIKYVGDLIVVIWCELAFNLL